MINYTVDEIKKAILQTIPAGTRIDTNNITNYKWNTILNKGFENKGWLHETNYLRALGELRKEGFFERHRDLSTRQRFYVRVH